MFVRGTEQRKAKNIVSNDSTRRRATRGRGHKHVCKIGLLIDQSAQALLTAINKHR